MVANANPVRTPRAKPNAVKTDLPRPLHARVLLIRARLAELTGRSLTIPETLERIVTDWEREHP